MTVGSLADVSACLQVINPVETGAFHMHPSSLADTDMTPTSMSFFSVIGHLDSFRIRSDNGSWMFDIYLAVSTHWYSGSWCHCIWVRLLLLLETLTSFHILSLIGRWNPVRIQSVKGRWRLDSYLWLLLWYWYSGYWCLAHFSSSPVVIDITIASFHTFSVIGLSDPFKIRYVNGIGGLTYVLGCFYATDPVETRGIAYAFVFSCC